MKRIKKFSRDWSRQSDFDDRGGVPQDAASDVIAVVNSSGRREPLSTGGRLCEYKNRSESHWDSALAHAGVLCLKFRTLLRKNAESPGFVSQFNGIWFALKSR